VPFEDIHILFCPPIVKVAKQIIVRLSGVTVRMDIMGKSKKFLGKIVMKDYSSGLTTDGKTVFIDLTDVGCEGVDGFRWLRVCYEHGN
jgi:hypothetical protein